MTEVRVGDVYLAEHGKFVVTNYNQYDGYTIIATTGDVRYDYEGEFIKQCQFIKHYDTFVEAIASKEFKGENS